MKSRRTCLEGVKQATETHAGLWLDKYIQSQPHKLLEQNEEQSRHELVKKVAELPISSTYKAYYKRWENALKAYGAETRKAHVQGRMIVGLGSESVLEASVALHRTYGIPYIPGSALKGLAASYARQRLDGQWKEGEKGYNVVFGDTDDAGYITFFDALYIPDEKPPLHSDVITVHHPQYYQGTSAPTDRDSPTPIPFLSATGTYAIALAAPDIEGPQRKDWIDKTFDILAHALAEMGIGAKTSSGYGRMRLEAPKVDPEIATAQAYKQEIERMQNKDVLGQLGSYSQKWHKLTNEEARQIVATAIVTKVQQSGVEKKLAEKNWYREVLAFLSEKV